MNRAGGDSIWVLPHAPSVQGAAGVAGAVAGACAPVMALTLTPLAAERPWVGGVPVTAAVGMVLARRVSVALSHPSLDVPYWWTVTTCIGSALLCAAAVIDPQVSTDGASALLTGTGLLTGHELGLAVAFALLAACLAWAVLTACLAVWSLANLAGSVDMVRSRLHTPFHSQGRVPPAAVREPR